MLIPKSNSGSRTLAEAPFSLPEMGGWTEKSNIEFKMFLNQNKYDQYFNIPFKYDCLL